MISTYDSTRKGFFFLMESESSMFCAPWALVGADELVLTQELLIIN